MAGRRRVITGPMVAQPRGPPPGRDRAASGKVGARKHETSLPGRHPRLRRLELRRTAALLPPGRGPAARRVPLPRRRGRCGSRTPAISIRCPRRGWRRPPPPGWPRTTTSTRPPRTASASTRPPSGRAAAGRPPNAYLRPAIDRANLTVETDALATGVLIEDGRAVGVRYLRDGAERVARAGRQHGVPPVILPRPLRRIRGPHDHAHDPHPGQLPRNSQPTGGRRPARRTAGRPCGPGPGSATRSS